VIIEWLLDMVEAVFNFVAGLFPSTTFNPVTLFGGALAHLGDLNYFLPITELAAVVLAFVVLFPVFMGTTLFLWLVALIRGGSSRG
jgi:hypothetical protein